ncbi:MAG TPA: coproporphyrinogen III oxidase, partial [Chromatiaceae bacterium]|nr:coproporphyrinogen III oxidase [Chromatiaceae bacterium]
LRYADIADRWGIDFGAYFAQDLPRLQPMQADGLLEMDDQGIRVLPRGRLLIRNICMAFDAYRNGPEAVAGFSKVI